MSTRSGVDAWSYEDDDDRDYIDWANSLPDEGQVVAGVVASIGDDIMVVDTSLGRDLGRIPSHELPAEINGKPREALSVGDEIEAVVLHSHYQDLPVLSVALLQERLAWSEYPAEDGATTNAPEDRAPARGAWDSQPSVPVQPRESAPEAPDSQRHGGRAVPSAIEYQLFDPVEFLQPNRRLFIDTNVFMDTDARRAGGLKRLFERGQTTILANNNPVVVPTKVIGELTKQSQIDPSGESEERAEAIKKAGNALTFLESASKERIVRKDLGDDTNPYADDLFLQIFERFADTYEMCLLTHDITIKLRIRLLAHRLAKRLLVGMLTMDGDLEVDSDEALFERGYRKYNRHAAHIAEGTGNLKDESEVAVLKPLLEDFGKAFGLKTPAVKLGSRTTRPSAPSPSLRRPSAATAAAPVNPFSARARIKPSDSLLSYTALPSKGDRVEWTSADKTGTFVLGALLGEGGEGAVYQGDRSTVVKIFDKDHLTRHRKEKIELLVGRNLHAKGLCIPSAVVRNSAGEFVGYVMPKASGREFQRTIFNKRKFEREFPTWKKADLVDICISFLEKVEYLHSMNVILGDINPKNLMVDEKKNVFIIDADSWQLEGYPCPVGTPMFTSPSMLGKTYSDDLRTMEDELFAVATMLFMIVMTGQFPYIRTGTDGDMVQLIKEGNFAFQYENRNNKDQPDGDWKYMWSHVHKPVKDLFWHTFHREGKRYKKRPTAAEWLEAFKAYKSYLRNSRVSFDPMSNDVYPIRNKAFKQDTPIQDCPTCGRKDAIAGIWNDDSQDYFVPRQCNKCRDQQPGRAATSRSASVPCRDCGLSFPKNQLRYGRCPSCAQRDGERQDRASTLDPSRLCTRCKKPYITYGNVEWHQRNRRSVPTTHKTGPGGRYPAGCVPTLAPAPRSGAAPSAARPSTQAPAGFWARLWKWFADN